MLAFFRHGVSHRQCAARKNNLSVHAGDLHDGELSASSDRKVVFVHLPDYRTFMVISSLNHLGQLSHCTIFTHLFQDVVEFIPQEVVVFTQADAELFVAHLVVNDFKLARLLGHVVAADDTVDRTPSIRPISRSIKALTKSPYF